MLILGEQYCRPMPPVEVADEAQKWAREKGRRFGRMEWSKGLGCFTIRFGRKPDDPVMRAWQEGDLDEEPFEMLILHEWDAKKRRYVPMNVDEMGAGGLRALLDQADLTSGRGEFNSLQQAVVAMRERNAKVRENQRKQFREMGQELDWLHGRSLAGTPYITAGIDLKTKAGS